MFAWRTGNVGSQIRFGWLDTAHFSIREIVYDESNAFNASEDDRLQPSRVSISVVPLHKAGRWVATQEDPRLLSLSDGSVLVLYAGSYGKFDLSYRGNRDCLQFYSIGKYSYETNSIVFDESILLNYPEGGHQKNWVHLSPHSHIALRTPLTQPLSSPFPFLSLAGPL